MSERNNLLDVLGQQPNTHPDVRKAELQNLARARDLSQGEVAMVAARPISYSTIVKSAGDEALGGIGKDMLVIWMLNSGSIHDKKWATWSMIDRKKLASLASLASWKDPSARRRTRFCSAQSPRE